MEQVLLNELIKNTAEVYKNTSELGASYNEAMKNALEKFKAQGIPTKKNEDWIYTNISKNLAPRFFARHSEIVQDIPAQVIDRRGMIIFNNGVFNRHQSVLPEGIVIDQQVASTDFFDSFDTLNFSVSLSPLFIKIIKNTILDFPVTIVHLVDDAGVNKIISPRITVNAEEFTKVSIVEIFTSTKNSIFQYTTNSSVNFNLKDRAFVEHVKIQIEAAASTHIGLTKAVVAGHAQFKSMTIDLGVFTSRHNIDVSVNGEGGEAHVNGLYALKKSEHADIFSVIHHNAAHTNSDQLFKGILAGESRGAFTGKIQIAKDAQQVNSNQLNKNLMLSKKAHIDTRPQLLVAADDVKCAHGATIGQLSPDEEFYLESRGIQKDKAKRMLCHGFAMDVLFKIENPKIQKLAIKLLDESFEKTALSEMTL
ncbi:MAG: Fe-S cluster assembly protein SufD [Bacteriovorax sp.]|nr:Fe-S cluster assembly protein SufD [Bacteriovorax sp.]